MDKTDTATLSSQEIGFDTSCGNSGFADQSAAFHANQFESKLEYPLDALGPILGDAARALAHYVQAPKGIAGQSVLAAAALVAQGHINVQRGALEPCPVSLFLLTEAESGDRKSTLDKLALKPIKDFQEQRIESQKSEWAEYYSGLRAWEIRKSSIEGQYKKKKTKITYDEQASLKEALLDMEKDRPNQPRNPNITIEEPTAEAIWRHFQYGDPSVGLFSDEGITFFGGHGMNDDSKGRMIGLLSQLWDGKHLTRTRAKEGESGVMAERRLSAHLMIQPIVCIKIFNDPLLMGQGIMARFLLCSDSTLAGTRFLADRDMSRGPSNDNRVNRYWKLLEEKLNISKNIDPVTGSLMLKTLLIEGEALEAWVTAHDGIESQLGIGGLFNCIKPFACKAAENIARISAVLAFMEGFEKPNVVHITRATTIIEYYLETLRIKMSIVQIIKEDLEAQEVLGWMRNHGGELSASDFKRLPSDYRKAEKARAVLKSLVKSGALYETSADANGNPSAWRIVNDD